MHGPRWYNYIAPALSVMIFYLAVLEFLINWSGIEA
jgi:hypothetical protein